MPNYLLVTVTSTERGNITTNVTVQHPVTRIRVALPQNVDECNLIVRVRAQNSAGKSSATEIPVGKLIIATIFPQSAELLIIHLGFLCHKLFKGGICMGLWS